MRSQQDRLSAHRRKTGISLSLVPLAAALAFAAGPSGVASAPKEARASAAPDSAARKYRAPADLNALIDQEGRPFSFGKIAKKTVLLNFIFTSCQVSCPAQTQALVGIQRALPPDLRPRIRIVSVTVDPERDTAPALKAYAKAMGADLSDWSFVTGKALELDWLQRYYAAMDTARNEGSFNHQVGVYLIDARGRLMQKYAGNFDKPRLLREIRQLDSLHE